MENQNIAFVVIINNEDTTVNFLGVNEYLGVGYMKSHLKKNGINSKIHLVYSKDVDKIGEIFEAPPFLVGFAVYTDIATAVLKSAKILKEQYPNVHITLGGPQTIGFDEDILKDNAQIDSVITGEGELVLLDLITKLRERQELAGCLGLTCRSNGSIIKNEAKSLIDDLDTLDFPDRDVFEMERQEYFYIAGSRGCLGFCSFCGETEIKRKFKKPYVRIRTPKNIVDEMEYLMNKYKLNSFRFTDATFEDPGEEGLKKAEGVFDEIIRRKLDVSLHIFSRAELITENSKGYLEKGFRAGLECIYVGIEAGNEPDLKLYNKKASLQDNKRAIKVIREAGIHPAIGFICFNPYSTYETLFENADFLYQSGFGHVFYLYQTRLELLPQSFIRRQMLKDGLINDNKLYLHHFYDYQFKNPKIGELHQVIKKAFEKTPIYFMDTLLGMQRVWVSKYLKDDRKASFDELFSRIDEIKVARQKLNYDFFRTCVQMSKDDVPVAEIKAFAEREAQDIYYEEFEKLYFKINVKVSKLRFKMFNML